MNGSSPHESLFPRWVADTGVLAMIATLSLIFVTQSGCGVMWKRVREQERGFAADSARNQMQHGECDAALLSLDRAQATLNIGIYARQSTAMRAGCYERLGLAELATAHRRLLTDFYENASTPVPKPNGSTVFRVSDITFDNYKRPPSRLKIAAPRYSKNARRSGIIGRVVISFELSAGGRPRKIRVLEMPHPLLASWAIEATAQGKLKKTESAVLLQGENYITVFDFEWRWARNEDVEQGS